ncbi:6438_t:CDS:2 [Paraglomus brasilianum]|uniref:6438_t:CDS:1 n=1 Tax=Paraglomus brasilianum TaxID=144538 RepID=A0A9N8WQV4_9GLOM|nr:6438_t:CDS:2 [Paraglomus brasilianum]
MYAADDDIINRATEKLLTTKLPDRQAIVNSTNTALELLHKCEIMNPDDDVIKQFIKSVKKEKTKFRDLTNKSLKHSMQLSDHADDMAVYFQAIMQSEGLSSDHYLESFENSLTDAQNLQNGAEQLQSGYKSIIEHLQEIKESCEGYQEHLEQCEKLAIEEESLLAANGPPSFTNMFAEVLDGIEDVSTAVLRRSKIAKKWLIVLDIALPMVKVIVINLIDALLNGKKQEFKKQLAELQSIKNRSSKNLEITRELIKNLSNIKYHTSAFETFWSAQVTALKEIIHRFRRLPQQSQTSQLLPQTIVAIVKKYDRLKTDCSIYSREVRVILDQDAQNTM